MEALRVGMVQYAPSDNASNNRATLDAAFDQFDEVDLILLPEYSSWYHPDPSHWESGAESVEGDFVAFLRGTAARLDATMIAGMLIRGPRGLTNTVVAVDDSGLVGRYDKVHLYDAFGSSESTVVTAGDPAAEPLVVTVKGWKVGVQTCYDLRFPEVSRRLIDAGATVLAVLFVVYRSRPEKPQGPQDGMASMERMKQAMERPLPDDRDD